MNFDFQTSLQKNLSDSELSKSVFAKRLSRGKSTLRAWLAGEIPTEKDIFLSQRVFQKSFPILEGDLDKINRFTSPREKAWAEGFPFQALLARKYFQFKELERESAIENFELRADMLLRFFNCATIEAWENIYGKNSFGEVPIPFSESLFPKIFSTWFRCGEIARERLFKKTSEKSFDKARLSILKKIILEKTREMTKGNFRFEVQKLCALFGIQTVYVPNFPQARAGAIALFRFQKPFLIFSDRYQTIPEILSVFFEAFLFFEEENSNAFFVRDIPGFSNDLLKKEKSDFEIFSEAGECELLSLSECSEEAIRYFSRAFKTAPEILLYRLEERKRLPKALFKMWLQMRRNQTGNSSRSEMNAFTGEFFA